MKHIDKILHGACCCFVAAMATVLLLLEGGRWYMGVTTGLLSAMGAGLGKEYGDYKASGNDWSWGDVLADAVGAVAGCAVGCLILIN